LGSNEDFKTMLENRNNQLNRGHVNPMSPRTSAPNYSIAGLTTTGAYDNSQHDNSPPPSLLSQQQQQQPPPASVVRMLDVASAGQNPTNNGSYHHLLTATTNQHQPTTTMPSMPPLQPLPKDDKLTSANSMRLDNTSTSPFVDFGLAAAAAGGAGTDLTRLGGAPSAALAHWLQQQQVAASSSITASAPQPASAEAKDEPMSPRQGSSGSAGSDYNVV